MEFIGIQFYIHVIAAKNGIVCIVEKVIRL